MTSRLVLASIIFLSATACKTRNPDSVSSVKTEEASASWNGSYASDSGKVVTISDQKISFASQGDKQDKPMEGTLQADRAMGGVYLVRFPEGYVCGSFSVSFLGPDGRPGKGDSFKVNWNPPEGSVVKDCGDMKAFEGSYSRRSQPSLGGTYSDSQGNAMVIQKGKVILSPASGQRLEATLDRDGTMGASYRVVFPEGHVCGTYTLSLWVAEGQIGDGSTFQLSWNKPEGSVLRDCAEMTKSEGRYKRVSQFGGYYSNSKGTQAIVAGGQATLILPGDERIEGSLVPEGTLGGSYLIQMKEGFVCGQFRISLWAQEGQVGNEGSFESKWIAPKGSVIQHCGSMTAGEGLFQKN